MGVEEKIDKLAEAQNLFHGEVREFMKNTTAYIGAVSSNQKTHEKDPDAHPSANRQWWSNTTNWVLAIFAAAEFFFHVKGK